MWMFMYKIPVQDSGFLRALLQKSTSILVCFRTLCPKLDRSQVRKLFYTLALRSSPCRINSFCVSTQRCLLRIWVISKPDEMNIWTMRNQCLFWKMNLGRKAMKIPVSSIRRSSLSLSFCCPQGKRVRSPSKLRSGDFHQLHLWCFYEAFKTQCQLWYIFKNQSSGKFKAPSDHTVL